MSYKQNIVINNGPVQLVDKSRFGNSVTQGGVTCTNNGDGSWTINGNVTAENRFNLNFYQLGANVIPYWLSYMVPVEHNYYTQDCGYDKLGGWLFYYLEEGKNYENFKIYPQIISLTDTFGSGNEPKNKEQVKAKFPDNLYPYNPTNRVTTYKELIKVSDVCQLVDTNGKTVTEKGVTCTNNGDGSWTLNGINETDEDSYLNFANIGARYFAGSIYINSDPNNGGYVVDCNYDVNNGQVFYTLKAGVNYDNLILKPQVFDLRKMYGVGNEPKTVAEFKAKFPNTYYPYSPNCWITSYKNVSKVSDVCQLINKKRYPAAETKNGVTFTNNEDGTVTLNGTATAWAPFLASAKFDVFLGHKYLLYPNPTDVNVSLQLGFRNVAGVWLAQWLCNSPTVFTLTDKNAATGQFWVGVEEGKTVSNVTVTPQAFDLTEMYGVGNEPKTVAEFRAKFPNEMYDYNLCCTV